MAHNSHDAIRKHDLIVWPQNFSTIGVKPESRDIFQLQNVDAELKVQTCDLFLENIFHC